MLLFNTNFKFWKILIFNMVMFYCSQGMRFYVDNDNIKKTLDNIASVLKSGALLLISVLDGDTKNNERSYIKVGEFEYDKNALTIVEARATGEFAEVANAQILDK